MGLEHIGGAVARAVQDVGDKLTLRDFHNRLRILRSIDMHELVDAGVISSDDTGSWQSFRADPDGWFVRASDDNAERLWALMDRRCAGRNAQAPAPLDEAWAAVNVLGGADSPDPYTQGFNAAIDAVLKVLVDLGATTAAWEAQGRRPADAVSGAPLIGEP